MLSARLATVATIAGLTAALLAGCSSTSSPAKTSAAGPSEATPTTSTVLRQHAPQDVRIVKVTGPSTIVVTPTDSSDVEFGTDFTVQLDDLVAPAKGDCGFDESLKAAEKLLPAGTEKTLTYPNDGVILAVEKNGDHNASIGGNAATFTQGMLTAGMARMTDHNTWDGDFEANAKTAGTGLWSTCPGFDA